MKRRAILLLSVAIVLITAGGVASWRWWHNRPPYDPGVLGARATLQLVDQATADAALKPVNAVRAAEGDQIVLGRVTWSRPSQARKGDSFRIVLLDKRSHLMPGFIAVTSARPDDVSTGLDGAIDSAQKRDSWLRGAGTQEGSAIFVEAVDVSPVTFQTVFRAPNPEAPPSYRVPTAPVSVEDLLVALIGVGPDGQVYWTQRLLN
ncbi:hypothetical protein [Paractinoplanes maris]|uniref:hypothetical protein n=1 Tax=Paractinoplanes maris TaxID=1734446 RepID=UPI0020203D5C|nr:hypothetical protein [Actinoplanes maris]